MGVIRLRALALHGVQTSAGAGPNRMIAAMAADITPPGAATIVGNTPYDIAAFLRPRPAAALPGIGPAAARVLDRLGIRTVGDIADTPLATLQRILGTAAGRQAHDRALGTDDRPIVPDAAPKSLSRTHRFDRDELDPEQHHRAVLGLVEQLGAQLRHDQSIAAALTLNVTYADRTTTSRTRILTEATARTPALAGTGHEPNASNPPRPPPTNSPSTPTTTRLATWRPPWTAPAPGTGKAPPAPRPPVDASAGPVRRSRGPAGVSGRVDSQ
ncbi:hypothetical protein [Streptomyces sp. NPDC058579]|uniref:DNA polymerase Y family protein n=1 Tax=Streptomyces sp. NPDC058579 TaxID=3346548 RepID=UPI00364CE3FE